MYFFLFIFESLIRYVCIVDDCQSYEHEICDFERFGGGSNVDVFVDMYSQ